MRGLSRCRRCADLVNASIARRRTEARATGELCVQCLSHPPANRDGKQLATCEICLDRMKAWRERHKKTKKKPMHGHRKKKAK